MPYTDKEIKIRRLEREVATLTNSIHDMRQALKYKVSRREKLLDRLRVLKEEQT